MLRTIGVSEDFCDDTPALNGVCISILPFLESVALFLRRVVVK
ncbi:hypothetical protein ACNKHR_15170 [Shigella flexneri]